MEKARIAVALGVQFGDRGGRVRRGSGVFGANWVRFARETSGFICFVFGKIGFVPQFFPQGFEAVEFLDCPAVLAFGLGLVAQEQGKAVGLEMKRWKPSPSRGLGC